MRDWYLCVNILMKECLINIFYGTDHTYGLELLSSHSSFFFFLYQHWDFFFADIEFESEEMVVEPNYVFTKLQFYYIFSYNLDLSYVISQVDLRKIPLLLLQ